jgi:hypothetical protein
MGIWIQAPVKSRQTLADAQQEVLNRLAGARVPMVPPSETGPSSASYPPPSSSRGECSASQSQSHGSVLPVGTADGPVANFGVPPELSSTVAQPQSGETQSLGLSGDTGSTHKDGTTAAAAAGSNAVHSASNPQGEAGASGDGVAVPGTAVPVQGAPGWGAYPQQWYNPQPAVPGYHPPPVSHVQYAGAQANGQPPFHPYYSNPYGTHVAATPHQWNPHMGGYASATPGAYGPGAYYCGGYQAPPHCPPHGQPPPDQQQYSAGYPPAAAVPSTYPQP